MIGENTNEIAMSKEWRGRLARRARRIRSSERLYEGNLSSGVERSDRIEEKPLRPLWAGGVRLVRVRKFVTVAAASGPADRWCWAEQRAALPDQTAELELTELKAGWPELR